MNDISFFFGSLFKVVRVQINCKLFCIVVNLAVSLAAWNYFAFQDSQFHLATCRSLVLYLHDLYSLGILNSKHFVFFFIECIGCNFFIYSLHSFL